MTSSPNKTRLPSAIDAIDHKLLALLRANSRMTNNAMAEAVGLAPSTCLARIKALRDSSVVQRFTIDVDAAALGYPLQALVAVRLRAGARNLMNAFGDELRGVAEVSQFFVLGGADDFLIHITARDTDHVRQFVLEHLSSNPAVAGTTTSLVFEHAQGNAPTSAA